MAAAHRMRRRSQLPRRRKHTTRRTALHRKQHLPKQRKQCLKLGKQKQKAVSKEPVLLKPDLKRPYDELVVKVLQKLHRDKVPISTKAKGKLISFIRRFYNNVSKKAKCSRRGKKNSCTIGTKELQKVLKRVMRKKQAMELVKNISKPRHH